MRYAPIAQLDRVTDYESVGRGFESLSAYQKNRYPFRDNGFSNMSVEWDSNNQMQQSGGLLLAAGLDGGNTLIFLSMRKEKCKRVPFGVLTPYMIMDAMVMYGVFIFG